MNKTFKVKNKKGFTLMEMLIVIGIIAVLVAIAIPTFTGAKKKAQYAADQANVRAWYAEALVKNMSEDTTLPTSYKSTGPKLQMKDATVTVSGTTAEEFKVTYDPNGSTGDESGYESVTFPTPADTSSSESANNAG